MARLLIDLRLAQRRFLPVRRSRQVFSLREQQMRIENISLSSLRQHTGRSLALRDGDSSSVNQQLRSILRRCRSEWRRSQFYLQKDDWKSESGRRKRATFAHIQTEKKSEIVAA